MRTRSLTPPLATLAAAMLAVTACSRSDRRDAGTSGTPPSAGGGPSAGEVSITSTRGEVVLALVRDTVVMRLSDSVLAKAQKEIDTSGTGRDSSALGSSIKRMITGAVSQALRNRIAVPVSDIQDIRYEDGEIKFRLRRHGFLTFDNVRVDGTRSTRAFRAEDAQRFVAAVRAAQARQAGRG